MENFLLLGGFIILSISLSIGYIMAYMMRAALNKDQSSQNRIPQLHLFNGLYLNDIISTYRKTHKHEPLNKLYVFFWILFGAGFLMVIGSHYATH
jgi:hypothetical protein